MADRRRPAQDRSRVMVDRLLEAATRVIRNLRPTL